MRLSSDDGGVGDSDSIVNQRQILTQYAHDNGFMVMIIAKTTE